MAGTSQQLFLQVKEKLDYYRLPTIFPIQATDLLYKLVKLLDKYRLQPRQNNGNVQNIKNPQNVVQAAMKREMGKVIKENNRLHLQLINANQQIQSLKHCLDKIAIEKSSNTKQTQRIISLKNFRENQLFEQLIRAKYRYNQLIDMVHEDPQIEKIYIKRLYKPTKYNLDSQMRDTSEFNQKRKSNLGNSNQQDLFDKIQILQNKLRNRQTEISRLQNKLQYDGLNLNRIMKDFNDESNRSKVSAMQQQLEYLEQENKKMKQQVTKSRNTGGLKQALRDQVKKNHQQIRKLDNDNKNLRRKVKQTKFDQTAKIKENKRGVQKAESKLKQQQKSNYQLGYQITDLQKKVEFFAKQADLYKNEVESLKREIQRRQIIIEELKNVDAGNKILQKYQLQNLRRKIEQSDQLMRQLISSNKKMSQQNLFLRQQGGLKSQAIQNLQNIVDQLKRRNLQNQQSLIAAQQLKFNQRDQLDMMRQIVDLKQQIVHLQNQKSNVQIEYERALNQLQRNNKQNIILNDEIARIKCKLNDERDSQQNLVLLKRQLQQTKIALKKQESARARVQSLMREIQSQKDVFRKQLNQMSLHLKANDKVLKKQINDKDIKIAQLQEANGILDLRVRQKQSKIKFLEQKLNQYQNKLKNMNDQIAVVQEQRHAATKDKHRAQKRNQQLLKQQQLTRQRQLQIIEINNNQHATQLILLRKEMNGLVEKNAKYAQAYDEMADLVTILRRQKDQLNIDKINYIRQNDHLRLKIQDLERQLTLRLVR